MFEEWQGGREDKDAMTELCGFDEVDLTNVQPLTGTINEMLADTLNFWLKKFIIEVRNQSGGSFPAKTLNLIVCTINHYLSEAKQSKSFNILAKGYRR